MLNSKKEKKVQEGSELMKERIIAVAKDSNSIRHHCVSRIRMLSVSELRKELTKLRLDVSGSKEVLICKLKGSSK